jgi:polyisoprenoid-binding protein YceI
MSLTALLLFIAPLAFAQQVTVQVDPAATQVEFTVDSTLHTVHGSFHLKSGAITFDRATGKASGTLVVDAATGESGDGKRDDKMRREVLETQKFPDLVFTAQEVTGKLPDAGASHLEIHGVFRIHGQDHPLTLAVDTESRTGVIEASTKFAVPYVAWGMKNPSVAILRVNKTVTIAIHTQVHLTKLAATR